MSYFYKDLVKQVSGVPNVSDVPIVDLAATVSSGLKALNTLALSFSRFQETRNTQSQSPSTFNSPVKNPIFTASKSAVVAAPELTNPSLSSKSRPSPQ